MRDRTDEHLARLGALLEPRREVDDRADAHLLLGVRRSDEVHDRLAGLEAHAHPEGDLAGRPRRGPGPRAGRRAQGALGVVGVGDRRAEEGVDRVPDVLLDRPALARDDRAQLRERRIERGLQALRTELDRELGRTDDVDEQRRHEPPLLDPCPSAHGRNATGGTHVPVRRPIVRGRPWAQPPPVIRRWSVSFFSGFVRSDGGLATIEYIIGAAVVLGTLVVGVQAWNNGLVLRLETLVTQMGTVH